MKRIIITTLVALAALLPASRVLASVSSECGVFSSVGGGFNVNSYFDFDSATCGYELTYGPSMTPGKPIDLASNAPSAGTYIFDTYNLNTVSNQTTFNWDDYHYELGQGTLANFVNFGGESGTPIFVEVLDNGHSAPVSSKFGMVTLSSHSIAFFHGFVPANEGFDSNDVDFRVAVEVPTAGQFTLRQYFSVPEPGTLALLGLGLAGLAATRRRKR